MSDRLTFYGLGPGLKNVELAIEPVAAPFDVHRTPIVTLDHNRILRQLDHFLITQRVSIAQFYRYVTYAGALFLKNHLDELGSQISPHNTRLTAREDGFTDGEFIGIHSPLDDRFAEAVA